MQRLVTALALLTRAIFAGETFAHEGEPSCMVPIPVTASLVRETGESGLVGNAVDGATPAFLTGWLSPTRATMENADVFGAVVFARTDGGVWRAFLPQPGEGIVGIYTAPASGVVIIVTMWGTEGPGSWWTLLRSSDGLKSAACVTLKFPDALNQPTWSNEFLDLVDLDIGADGKGEIIGVARTEDRGELWYAYRTSDGGTTWSVPQKLPGPTKARPGAYAASVETAAPVALVKDLTAYAKGR